MCLRTEAKTRSARGAQREVSWAKVEAAGRLVTSCGERKAFSLATGKWSSRRSAGSRRYTSCQLARLFRVGPFKAVVCSRRGPLSASSLPRRPSHPRPPPHPPRSSSPASERVSVGSRAVAAGSGRSSRHSTRFLIESRWCRTTCETEDKRTAHTPMQIL